MENLHYYYAIVEEALLKLNINPLKVRGDEPGQWNLKKGSAGVWLDVWHDPEDKRSYFQVMSPIIPLPKQNKEKLFEDILHKNNYMFGTFFVVFNKKVWIKVNRECRGMDADEAYNLIKRTGTFADLYDDELSENYLGRSL